MDSHSFHFHTDYPHSPRHFWRRSGSQFSIKITIPWMVTRLKIAQSSMTDSMSMSFMKATLSFTWWVHFAFGTYRYCVWREGWGEIDQLSWTNCIPALQYEDSGLISLLINFLELISRAYRVALVKGGWGQDGGSEEKANKEKSRETHDELVVGVSEWLRARIIMTLTQKR